MASNCPICLAGRWRKIFAMLFASFVVVYIVGITAYLTIVTADTVQESLELRDLIVVRRPHAQPPAVTPILVSDSN